MLQGKFGLVPTLNTRDVIAPFVAMEQQKTACRCAQGYTPHWKNNLHSGEPECHCLPNGSNLPKCPNVPAFMPVAPKGYKYIWNENTCSYTMVVDYDSGGGDVIVKSVIDDNLTNPTGILESAKNFISEHKLLAGAAVIGLGYMFFSGGLAASDRTVTSVTRFAPRKRNPAKRIKRRKRR